MTTMDRVNAQRVRFPVLGDDVETVSLVRQHSDDQCVPSVSPFEIRTVLVSAEGEYE